MLKKMAGAALVLVLLVYINPLAAFAEYHYSTSFGSYEVEQSENVSKLKRTTLNGTLADGEGIIINSLYYTHDLSGTDNRDELFLEVINNRDEDVSITAEVYFNGQRMYAALLSPTAMGGILFFSGSINRNAYVTLNMEYLAIMGMRELESIEIVFCVDSESGDKLFETGRVSIPLVREGQISFKSSPYREKLIDTPKLKMQLLGYQPIKDTDYVWLYYEYENLSDVDVKSGDVELFINGVGQIYYQSIDFEAESSGSGIIYLDRNITELGEVELLMELTTGDLIAEVFAVSGLRFQFDGEAQLVRVFSGLEIVDMNYWHENFA